MSLIILPEKRDFAGRIIALNLQKCKRFQCGGFWLNVNKPFATVEPNRDLQQDMIQQGLLDGRLVDITDQSTKGLEMEGAAHSAPSERGIVGNKVYLQIDSKGNVLVAIPRDNEEEAKFESELADTGSIQADRYKVADHAITNLVAVNPGDANDLMNQIGGKLETAKEKAYVPKFK